MRAFLCEAVWRRGMFQADARPAQSDCLLLPACCYCFISLHLFDAHLSLILVCLTPIYAPIHVWPFVSVHCLV